KGIKGDNNNVMLAAAMNLKRMMNKWKQELLLFLLRFLQVAFQFIKGLNKHFSTPPNRENGFLRID
ncbi:hypothetical protein, partial [Hydrotalea sp.]|uniref:hypothetical protein n=1 Tax=Hydrotalea sp. TaxID=2881279 RepID=UPI00260EE36E